MPSDQRKTVQFGKAIRRGVTRATTLGGLSWAEVATQLWKRIFRDDLFGRAAQLSYYFLMAIIPLLIFVSAILGHLFATKEDLYLRLLLYLQTVMPPSAFELLSGTLKEITQETVSGRLTLGLILSVWLASSGMEAIIETLNIAYAVPEARPWWRRRLVAIALTISLGLLIATALFLILAGNALAVGIGNYFPIVERIGRLSSAAQWIVGMIFLLLALTLVFRFAPNLRQSRLEANLPGAVLSLACWLGSSAALKTYLVTFGTFHRTYGSLGAVIALLIWLYVSGAAILIGGELNSVIWQAVVRKRGE